MMCRPSMAWRNIRHNRAGTLALFLLSLSAMALMVVASSLGGLLRNGLTGAVEPFELLVGYGGSYQMVLNAVFLQDYPAGSIPYRVVEELRNDARVESAIPLAFGDNYRGYRLVGTDADIFLHRATARGGLWLRMAAGRPFAPGSREAVVGARVARECALQVGDAIRSSHGFIAGGEEDGHAHPEYRITGILAECGGPYDGAVLVDLRSIWSAHGIHPPSTDDNPPPHHHEDESTGSPAGGSPHQRDNGGDDHFHDGACDYDHEHEHEHVGGDSSHDEDRFRITAAMVRPVGYAEAYSLAADFASRRDADMVFPAGVITRLLAILGHAEWLFTAIGAIAGSIAFLTIVVALYWGAAARRREMTILRLLGAGRGDIAAILFFEGLFVTVPGLVAGGALGHLFLHLLGRMLAGATSLRAETAPSVADLGIFLFLALAGIAGEGLALRRLGREPAEM